MNNKIALHVQTLSMLAIIVFGVSVVFSSNTFPASADNTKKSELPITTSSQNHTISDTEKKPKIAFLTNGLFSYAG